jgi:hypothetical protein
MVTATAAALLLLLPAASVFQTPGVRKIGPKGGGACASATDCQLAGECKDSKCSCDPGWTGPLCSMLDLAPLPVGYEGGAWNAELSPHSSWGAAPLHIDGKYHGWFNQLPDKCGLSSWLPGSYIQHGVADSPLGPFKLVNDTPPTDGKRNPLSGAGEASFATNPHVAYVKPEKRYLLFFNGRAWPANDLVNCWPADNKTDTDGSHYHGGGACTSNADCAGAFAGTGAHQGGAANICGTDGKCSCEHHSMGAHCDIITETVNVASSLSPNVSKQPCPPARPHLSLSLSPGVSRGCTARCISRDRAAVGLLASAPLRLHERTRQKSPALAPALAPRGAF